MRKIWNLKKFSCTKNKKEIIPHYNKNLKNIDHFKKKNNITQTHPSYYKKQKQNKIIEWYICKDKRWKIL